MLATCWLSCRGQDNYSEGGTPKKAEGVIAAKLYRMYRKGNRRKASQPEGTPQAKAHRQKSTWLIKRTGTQCVDGGTENVGVKRNLNTVLGNLIFSL